MLRFSCPHCKKTINCKETLAGRKAKCPGCGGALTVPPNSVKWYFTVNGRRFGPVEKSALVRLAAQQKLKPTDKVWSKPLGAKWVDAGRIPGLFAVSSAEKPNRRPAAGGLTPNRELMREAREALKGKWGTAVGLLTIYILLIGVFGVIPFIGWLASLLIMAPLTLGLYSAFLALSRKEETSFNRLFSGFQRFGPALGAYFYLALMVLIWTALPQAVELAYFGSLFLKGNFQVNRGALPMPFPYWIFPVYIVHAILGTIAGLIYSLTFFNLADSPSGRPGEAVRKSREMMKGNIWKLFCLGCRFIGWVILGAMPFGIGLLWVGPYMMTSYACFYGDLKKEALEYHKQASR